MRSENYLVRIYRRDHANRQSLVGLVEAVNTGWQKPFHTLQELADILAKPGPCSGIGAHRAADRDWKPSDKGSKS